MSDMNKPRDYRSNPSQANPDVEVPEVQYDKNPEAEYGEHIRDTSAICNSDASHTYGNVLSVVEKYITDLFPPDLFKTVTASTTFSPRQVNHLPSQLWKKENPIMVLVPRIEFGQNDRFLGNTLFNSRLTNTAATWGDGSLLELGRDRNKGIFINGHYNRGLMFVDMILSFNTYSEQLNWMSYLNNVVPIGHNQFIRAPLELYIPENFSKLISEVSGVPIQAEDRSVNNFLSYMNTIWYHPITYKLNGGTNMDEFFMYYQADIDTVIQDPAMGPGIKDGQIRRNFDITFTVRCEFNTVGYFTLNAPSVKHNVVIDGSDSNDGIIPMFSDTINLDDFILPQGWVILGWPIFKLDYNQTEISLEPILNQSLNAVIDYHLQNNIPMDTFIKIQFRENGQILTDEMYWIDWVTRTLHIVNPDQHRTYRLLITVSQEYINTLIKNLYHLE